MKFIWTKYLAVPKIKSSFWKGAFVGLSLMVYFLAFLAGYFFNTGISPILMGLGFVVIIIPILFLVRILLHLVYKGLSKIAGSILIAILSIVATIVILRLGGFYWPQAILYESIAVAIAAQVLLFGSLYYLVFEKKNKALMVAFIVIGLATDVISIYWILSNGEEGNNPEFTQKESSELELPNPADPGTFEISTFTYGSGTDLRREEFGAGVRYKTPTVDASLILPEWKGTKAERRGWFWGFGVDEFPLNGRVWMPEGNGPFPILLIVHGNHGMEDFSDAGYGYLGELLASRGIIAVSVDENFINATWSGDFRGREMPARAWLLLKHLELWREWNKESAHDFHSKVNMDKVMLAGHSRGGEAVAIAAAFNKLKFYPDNAKLQFDFNFKIEGIIAIAPTDKRYLRRLQLENINYLSIQGSYDSDEASFFGWRQARRIHFTDSNFWFKAGLYVHNANHGQFNTTWGSRDFGPPGGWMLNINSLLSKEDQEKVAKVYVSAFAEVVGKGNNQYLPVFRNSQHLADKLPKTIYVNNYQDSDMVIIENFENDIDITKSANGVIQGNKLDVWREDILLFRDNDIQGNNACVLGWKPDSLNNIASYEIRLDSVYNLRNISRFTLTAGRGNPNDLKLEKKKDDKDELDKSDDDNLSFTIQLIDSIGNILYIPFDHNKYISPRLEIEYMKLESLGGNLGSKWEPTLEYLEYSIDKFQGDKSTFQGIKSIRLLFDKTPKGVLIIDDIGFYPAQ